MIISVIPDKNTLKYKEPATILADELEDYDFTDCAQQIFDILSLLHSTDLIKNMPYDSAEDVLKVIDELIYDIYIDDTSFQQSEKGFVRVQFEDYLLAIEVFIGV